MAHTLNGAANDLGEHMSDISEDVYAAGWIQGNEWILWRALQEWRREGRAFWNPGSPHPWDISEHMPRLDRLHRQAGGWVWWLDYPGDRGGMQFVEGERWLRLVEAKRARPEARNEDLDRLVPATRG
ncbi:hypothetical protein ACIODS_11855 [Micromonospora chalcea]|uniref:hypothetical protein n=1 Tax=Micromonospora chalcea TaxID=1874 RepID=UPI0038168AAA